MYSIHHRSLCIHTIALCSRRHGPTGPAEAQRRTRDKGEIKAIRGVVYKCYMSII